MDLQFEMAQTLRKSHCEQLGEKHECVGTMTVCRGKIALDCVKCGKGEDIPGWSGINAIRVEAVFRAAGISWDSLSLPSQVAAIEQFEKSLRNA